MPPLIDITGQRFGRLVVLQRGSNGTNRHPRWECICDCGGHALVTPSHLKSGKTQSCGCLQKERSSAAASVNNATHRMTRTPEYRAWRSMFTRCTNRRAPNFHLWGGRGIAVCERWATFETFLADMGERPTPKHSLDRIDPDGNYEPSNCRWATRLEQANNRRDNEIVIIDGVEMTIRNAIRAAGNVISRQQAKRRILNGWSHKAAVSTPATR